MRTVILCGGYGTRIRDVATNIPKPMVQIGRFPILWHIMHYYAHWQFREFVICLGYQGHVIKDFFVNYHNRTRDFTLHLGRSTRIEYENVTGDEPDWQVTLAETGLDTMTGARIRAVERYVGDDENFMLTYGDGVGDVDLAALLEFHRDHGRVMTVTGVHPPGRYGELDIDEADRAIGFNEKPQVTEGRISGGFFVCRREIFDYLRGDASLVLEDQPMRTLVRDGELMVYRHDGFWHPMDTSRDYKLLQTLWDEGRAPWAV